MNAKKLRAGWIMFGASMLIFAAYTIFVYIPRIKNGLIDYSGAVESAMLVGIICGILGTIGLMTEKYRLK
ncbi:hypothetical protein J4401_06855 [Candidatus Woesearchaeota archaeon]|nr:hypothetical protein [Candidatus Woesearchaeota archaeon]